MSRSTRVPPMERLPFDLVKNKKQQIKNFDVQSYDTEQNAAKVIL